MDLGELTGAEVSAIGVLRHRRTAVELLRASKDGATVELVELQFCNVRRSEATFAARPWMGCLRTVLVSGTSDEVNVKVYEVAFDAGSWRVEAEGYVVNVLQSMPSTR